MGEPITRLTDTDVEFPDPQDAALSLQPPTILTSLLRRGIKLFKLGRLDAET